MVGKIFRVVGIVIVGIVILGLIGNNSDKSTSSDQAFKDCQRRGVAYYKDIGSYPLLSTGKFADEKIGLACSRTTKAFG
ncbi:MAG: hypothetical protein AAF950_17785 [Pseudomonadota bacterium]